MLVTCILASVSAGTRAEIHAIYGDFKISGMVYGESVFKGPMNKAIVENKQTTGFFLDQYDNLPSYMTTCDPKIAKFTLEWKNVVSLLEARGVVLTDKFKITWRAFELCKGAYFVKYMGFKQEVHEEDESPVPSLTVEKLLKFALDKYTDQYRINNHVWGSSSRREAEFIALTAKATTLKGNLKLVEKIEKNQKPSGGGGGPAPKARASDKRESQKENAARLALWQRKCIALKKVPPTLGGP